MIEFKRFINISKVKTYPITRITYLYLYKYKWSMSYENENSERFEINLIFIFSFASEKLLLQKGFYLISGYHCHYPIVLILFRCQQQPAKIRGFLSKIEVL